MHTCLSLLVFFPLLFIASYIEINLAISMHSSCRATSLIYHELHKKCAAGDSLFDCLKDHVPEHRLRDITPILHTRLIEFLPLLPAILW